jgi:hypothetical protein
LPNQLLLYQKQKDVCRNAKITQLLKLTISATIPSTSKVEHDIDDIPELKDWEMKDHEYELCDGTRPISYSIPKALKEIPLIH